MLTALLATDYTMSHEFVNLIKKVNDDDAVAFALFLQSGKPATEFKYEGKNLEALTIGFSRDLSVIELVRTSQEAQMFAKRHDAAATLKVLMKQRYDLRFCLLIMIAACRLEKYELAAVAGKLLPPELAELARGLKPEHFPSLKSESLKSEPLDGPSDFFKQELCESSLGLPPLSHGHFA